MRLRRTSTALALLAVTICGLLVSGCTAAPKPTPTPTPTPTATAAALDTSTLRTIIASPVETPVLTVVGPADPIAGETAQAVTYTSGGLTITGVIRTPAGPGPHPAVVVVHGAVDPKKYESGSDLLPEQRALLGAGYVVFAPDLRGFAGSDPADAVHSASVDPGFGYTTVLDWGMALDVVNALRLVDNGAIPAADPSRVGLLGHSLGGLLVLDAAVIAPGLSKLVVTMSAASSDFTEAFGSQTPTQTPDADVHEQWGTVGSPAEDPQYWKDVSPRTFFDRATEPLFLIHGSVDDTALPQWSEETAQAWRAAGNDAQALIIQGGDHLFSGHRDEADAAILAAFAAVIGSGG